MYWIVDCCNVLIFLNKNFIAPNARYVQSGEGWMCFGYVYTLQQSASYLSFLYQLDLMKQQLQGLLNAFALYISGNDNGKRRNTNLAWLIVY